MLVSKGEIRKAASLLAAFGNPEVSRRLPTHRAHAYKRLSMLCEQYADENGLLLSDVMACALGGIEIIGMGPEHGCPVCSPYGGHGIVKPAYDWIQCPKCG